MRELVDRAARISRGDRDAFQPLAHYGTRELAQLSYSFLEMAEQLARRSDYIAPSRPLDPRVEVAADIDQGRG